MNSVVNWIKMPYFYDSICKSLRIKFFNIFLMENLNNIFYVIANLSMRPFVEIILISSGQKLHD